jgi:hypothetical protein
MTTLMELPMATEKPKTMSVKLEMDVLETARIVAAFRGQPMTEMLSAILRPVLVKMEQEESAKRYKGRPKKGKTEGGAE